MMDSKEALRLIAPLQPGDTVAGEVRLTDIEIDTRDANFRKDAVILHFSSPLTLVIQRRTAGRSAFHTKNYGVTIKHPVDPVPRSDAAVIAAIRDRLMTNDTEDLVDELSPLHAVTKPANSNVDLWLIPGHIGNPQDMGFRALRVLRTVDLVFVEEGDEGSVEQIFELFELGPAPEVVEISTAPGVMETLLDEGRKAGKTMALFGTEEGAPCLCDPGWRVLLAEAALDPRLTVRSISAGSALATALMYLDRRDSSFEFTGIFRTTGGHVPLYKRLARAQGESRSLYSFATGVDLIDQWRHLAAATQSLSGRMILLCNLSKENEYRREIALGKVHETSSEFMDPDDKVVLRIDLNASNPAIRGLSKLTSKLLG